MSLINTTSFELAIYSKGNPNSLKLALVLPGRLDTKDYAHMKSHVDYLASKGFFAVSFDPPGTWESPGDISLYTMSNYLKAINEVIEYYGNKPTFVMGHSRGATMAMLVGTKNPYVTAFAAIFSSFSKGGYTTKEKDKEWKRLGYLLETRDLPPGGGPKVKEIKLPYAFFEDQSQHNMTEDLKQSPKPKLFVYGNTDVLAPPKVVKEMYEISSNPKELHSLDSGHDYRLKPQSINEANKILGRFLSKHNL
ncbi:MAG: alpha/beta fold hydrolase [Patescibacteria group bacterium]